MSTPSVPGSIKSSNTRSGLVLRNACIARSPSPTNDGSKPSLRRTMPSISARAGSSSTTRTRGLTLLSLHRIALRAHLEQEAPELDRPDMADGGLGLGVEALRDGGLRRPVRLDEAASDDRATAVVHPQYAMRREQLGRDHFADRTVAPGGMDEPWPDLVVRPRVATGLARPPPQRRVRREREHLAGAAWPQAAPQR